MLTSSQVFSPSINARSSKLGLLLAFRFFSERLNELFVLVLFEPAFKLASDVHQVSRLNHCTSVELALAVDV